MIDFGSENEKIKKLDVVNEVNIIQIQIKEMGKKQDAILSLLQGNGKPGMKTDVEVIKAGLFRAWWWLGCVSLAIAGVAIKTVF